ncbi:MAG: T9SS type A sorting domain-containing protein [Vicingaceae bacterium]|nr:T9SS type A sorting domain-containing protein [Vicingaceae bacterium]
MNYSKCLLFIFLFFSFSFLFAGGPTPSRNIGAGNYTGCGPLDYYDTGGSGGSYNNSENITETHCSNVAGQCIQFTFSSFNTESCCDDLSIYDGPTTGSPLIGTYAGTALPNGGTVTSSSGCLTFEWSSDGSIINSGWDASVSCVACPTCTDGILNGQEVGIDCGGPTCPPCPCNALPIINDEACCATAVTVNTDGTCTLTTPGTVANATPSFNGNTCFGNDDDDVWFSFVSPGTSVDISLLNVAGSTTDLYHAVYGGTCNATGASLICSDPNNSTVTGLIAGNTYFIRVYTYTGTGGQNTTFDVCVSTCAANNPTCGLNYSYSTTAYSPVNYTNGTLISFTDDRFAPSYTALPFPFCYDGIIYNDILVSSNGYIIFPGCASAHPFGTKRGPGDYSPYSIAGAAPNTTNAPVNAIMGTWQDIYPSGSSVDGEIRTRVHGTTPNQKFVIKFFDVRMYSCTSLDYNGQIMLYETSDNIEVHLGEKTLCTGFNSGKAIMGITDYTGTVANIPAGYNSPTQWTVPTGSPEGHRWTSNCGVCTILPVELINFKGSAYDNNNLITWKTESEINNDYFVLERSNGGATFYEVATINGAGNSNNLLEYSYQHNNPQEIEYYRLRQVDFDGKVAYSKIIVVKRKDIINVNLFPNPTNNNLFFDINNSNNEVYKIKYIDLIGNTIEENINILKGTNNYKLSKFNTLKSGIYFINIINEKGETIKIEKIIKQ